MKTLKLLFTISIFSLITGCSNDDDNPSNNCDPLYQSWTLIEVNGGFAGTDDEFMPGTIVWTFNENGTVQVTNNNIDENATDFFDTGSYEYEFVPNEVNPQGCDHTLTVNDINFGCVAINGNTLTLNQQPADGYLLTFIKN